MTTPPGWYPDPGQIPQQPPQERWWDGQSWTEHSRPAGGAAQAPPHPRGGAGRGPLIAGLVGAVVLLAALAVGAVLLFAGSDGDSEGEPRSGGGPETSRTPAPSAPGEPSAPESEPPTAPPGERGPAPAEGVRLPVLNGWRAVPGSGGAAVGIHEYRCPGEGAKQCVRGGSAIVRAEETGSAKKVAEADIEKNATSSYGADSYGGITSHSVVKKGEVKVAGQDGYRIRWKIDNKTDPDAYVESVAFPHPDGSGRMLVIRSGIDIHKDAPPLSDLDKLVDGVRRGSAADGAQRDV
ncbi:DUF2510 domain-containing protein [Streptomyces boncukensis]|uniref:DUF2510 domain-containing protein n=1 Tax=Streptomyces boncukensis TaxID=2711219 RepID=A0A6G4WS48_9ACTN|nr:DUF2510 domain-containing protein [Streptomyces boncukensis]NGO67311.1 DUF2510 domain-containing protein [Streptomyces boncukensis]